VANLSLTNEDRLVKKMSQTPSNHRLSIQTEPHSSKMSDARNKWLNVLKNKQ
jgi:hypothetical protein